MARKGASGKSAARAGSLFFICSGQENHFLLLILT
jgi:hypothetical protein